MDVIVLAMRQNAWRLQAQHKNEQTGNVAHDEQRHLNSIFEWGKMEPPVFLFQIDKGQILANERQRPEQQQHEAMAACRHRWQQVITFFPQQNNRIEEWEAGQNNGQDLKLENDHAFSDPIMHGIWDSSICIALTMYP